MNEVNCIAIDFDSTLAHFVGGHEGLFEIFLKRGISRENIEKAYFEAVKNGFSIEKLKENVLKMQGTLKNEDSILEEFEKWLSSALELYPDSLPSLLRWKDLGLNIFIVTFGDPQFQRLKIKKVIGEDILPSSNIVVTEKPDTKFEVLEKLTEQYGAPIIFIDDKPKELMIVKQKLDKKVITAFIYRSDSPFRKDLLRENKCLRLSSLFEVSTILKFWDENFIEEFLNNFFKP